MSWLSISPSGGAFDENLRPSILAKARQDVEHFREGVGGDVQNPEGTDVQLDAGATPEQLLLP